MATLNMKGPYSFNSDEINRVVAEGTIGNYALGRTNTDGAFNVLYVGRSVDVRKRLHEHLTSATDDWSEVTQFTFSTASNEVEAYKKECQNWHDFGESNLLHDNEYHPTKPDGQTELKCPVCGQ